MNTEPLLYSMADPPTSAMAANSMKARGKLSGNRRKVLKLVQNNPNCTAVELAEFTDLDRHEVSRRLPDLMKCGLVEQGEKRRCAIARTMQVTWVATPAGEEVR